MKMNQVEKRSLETVTQTNDNIVEGYALKFDTPSRDLGGFVEIIKRSALEGVDLSDVRCFLDHDSSKLLGRTKSGTLELNVDEVGLHFRCALPDTSDGRDARELIRRGDLNQCSFMFSIRKGGDSWKRGEINTRSVNAISEIFEISLVSIPAYDDTDVALAKRSMNEAINELDKQTLQTQIDIMSM